MGFAPVTSYRCGDRPGHNWGGLGGIIPPSGSRAAPWPPEASSSS